MTKSFLEFFESIQKRQDVAGTSSEAAAPAPGPSDAALAAAAAAPTSRPIRPQVPATSSVSAASEDAAASGKPP